MMTAPGAVPIPASGTWVHAGSGLEFPQRVGVFQRSTINRYNQAGTDVGVGYNYDSANAAIAFTVYVSPPVTLDSGEPVLPAQYFDVVKRIIHSSHDPAVEIWSREMPFVRADTAVEGHGAEFQYTSELAGRTEPVVSQLYLFTINGWIIKYRATFAQRQEREARQILESLLRLVPWGAAVYQQP